MSERQIDTNPENRMIRKNETIKEPDYKSSFKVPDGYFEDFAMRMNELIDKVDSEKENHSEKRLPLKISHMLTLKPLLYMAAMFVVLLFSITAVLKFSGSDKKQNSLLSSSTNDIKQVLTAEDYLISTVGTYAITEYYIDPEVFEE